MAVETGPDADLRKAALVGDKSGIEKALFAGADPLKKDSQGRTALHLAVLSKNFEAVKALLEPKADFVAKKSQRDGVAILNFLNNTGSKNNAWIGASLPDAIQGLMAENFDFKRPKPEATQKTALRSIGNATEYSEQLFKTLGAKTVVAVIISGSYTLTPDGKSTVIKTQVFATVENKLLFENEIHAPLDSNIFEALNQVAREIVVRLKEYASASFAIRVKNSEQPLISDVNARDRNGITPLALAGENNLKEIVDLLIKSGADYPTDIIEAINFSQDSVAVSLVQSAPDVNFRIAGGKTPLMQASFKGRVQVVAALLAKKANANLQDLYGFTALMYAAQEGHSEIVKEILTAKANVNIKTWDGFSALEAARRKGNSKIVEMLGKAGAK